MLFIDLDCDNCKHKREHINEWRSACDAFPEGIPMNLIFDENPSELEKCNNGIKFEKREEEE